MSIVRRVAKNTVFLAGSEIIHKILFFFLIIYATRVLGADDFGKYSFAFAFAYIFSVFASLGIGIIIIKDVSRNKDLMGKYFSGLLSLNLLLSLGVYFIIIIITVFLPYNLLYKGVILIACLSIILDGISGYCLAYFQADEHMEYVSISKILQTLIVFIFGALFLYMGKSLIWFVSAFLISSIITLIFIFIFVILKLVKFEIRFDIRLWKKILKASTPLALFGLFGIIYFRIDTLMLAFLKGDTEVGIYNSAFQIVSALLFIPGVFLTAIFPLLSSQYKNMKDSFLRTTNLALKIIVILAIPIAFGIAVLAKRVITIIYTPEYISAVLPLQVLSFVMMFIFMNYLFYSIINSIDRQDVIPKIMGVCMIINIILNYFFIIKFDTFGAALATLISNGIAFTLYYSFIKINIKKIRLIVPILRPLISALLMGYIILNLLWDLSMILIIPIAAIIYFILLLALKTFSLEEFNLILEIFGMKKYFPIRKKRL